MDVSLVVKKLIGFETGRDMEAIRPGQSLIRQLRMDNADLLSLVHNLEEVFGIEIPDEIVDKFRTVKDIINYIEDAPKEGNWQDKAKEFIISYNRISRSQMKEVLRGFDIIMEQYYWRCNWKYKKFRDKLKDCVLRLFYDPRRFYHRIHSPREDELRRSIDQRLEEIKKRRREERYTGLLSFPGSYEESFILRAEDYSRDLVKKILKRKASLKTIISQLERAAFRLWYSYGMYLHKDFDDMVKEQLDSIREEIRNNKYIPGWDEDLTEELVRHIEQEFRESKRQRNSQESQRLDKLAEK